MPTYNIAKDTGKYAWAVQPIGPKAVQEVPFITLIEYRQEVAQIVAQFKNWANAIKTGGGAGVEAYRNLYVAEPTGNKYILPFYVPYHHQIASSWGEAGGAIGEFVDKWVVPFAKYLKPSAGVEYPKAWQGNSPATYSFTFDLLNTITYPQDGGKAPRYKNNKAFIDAIILGNLHTKTSIITQEPPSIYEIKIPGVRYSPAAVITNLTVENMGQVNHLNGENVPDAFRLTVQVTELIVESQEIYLEEPKAIGSVDTGGVLDGFGGNTADTRTGGEQYEGGGGPDPSIEGA